MSNKIEAGVGFCLLFSPEEFQELREILEEAELPITKEGLKSLILDFDNTPNLTAGQRLARSLRDAIKNNPTLAQHAAKYGLEAAKKLYKTNFR